MSTLTPAQRATQRLTAASKVTDPAALIELARYDTDPAIRCHAARRITDQKALAELAFNDVRGAVRMVATERITDQLVLVQIYRSGDDEYVRRAAILRIEDQAVLADAALTDGYWFVRHAAVSRLQDQAALSAVLLRDPESEVRQAAAARSSDVEALTEVRRSHGSAWVRGACAKRLATLTPATPGKLTMAVSKASGYATRTAENAGGSDITLAIATDFTTAGERLTARMAGNKLIQVAHEAPDFEARVKHFVDKVNAAAASVVRPLVINGAGNGVYTLASKSQKEADDFAYKFLSAVMAHPDRKFEIGALRSGGQTGYDVALVKAALRLGIKGHIHAARSGNGGFLIRRADGKDVGLLAADYLKETGLDEFRAAEPSAPKAEVFVFGSNTEGRHGAGAALAARQQHGAVLGQARGRQGNAYAIVTKDLAKGARSVSLEALKAEVAEFLKYAREHADTTFNVTPIGTGLAGFTAAEIGPMFEGATANVNLPDAFKAKPAPRVLGAATKRGDGEPDFGADFESEKDRIEVNAKPMNRFGYFIDRAEPGDFFAVVRDAVGKTVYEIKGESGLVGDESNVFDDGFMGNEHDVAGLTTYLRSFGVIPEDGVVLSSEAFEALAGADEDGSVDCGPAPGM
jgi:hypothetical protein